MGLFNHLPRYRAAHPMPDEVIRMTLVGWPRGRSERAAKGFMFGFTLITLIGVVLSLLGVAWPIAGMVGVAVLVCFSYGRRSLRPRDTDELRLVALTSARSIELRPVLGGEPVGIDHPADWFSWGEVEVFQSFWIHRGRIPRVVLGDSSGEVLALEMPNVDVESLRLILDEAGLSVRPDGEADMAGRDAEPG